MMINELDWKKLNAYSECTLTSPLLHQIVFGGSNCDTIVHDIEFFPAQ